MMFLCVSSKGHFRSNGVRVLSGRQSVIVRSLIGVYRAQFSALPPGLDRPRGRADLALQYPTENTVDRWHRARTDPRTNTLAVIIHNNYECINLISLPLFYWNFKCNLNWKFKYNVKFNPIFRKKGWPIQYFKAYVFEF